MIEKQFKNLQTAYEDKQRDDKKLSVLASCLLDDYINSVDSLNF